MYKDYREKRPLDIEIKLDHYINTCFACPTIYDFKDIEGTSYYFRLRHGGAKLVCEDTDEVLIYGNMDGFDGVCSWDEFVEWAREYGVVIID